ncbi:hypothetical protein PTE30175_05412 [Pandoraea terrae]|uniref:Uncharacterized protein n=1 Tax=Pandoraea terrae TaxID=1537710 RepID=A0A5E4ZF69_9BURK|nr:hypothetical protein [Pandoraea terrae]VVE59307.1 hypothetical protein PTE30175_05412 [Pandoraea terrae]
MNATILAVVTNLIANAPRPDVTKPVKVEVRKSMYSTIKTISSSCVFVGDKTIFMKYDRRGSLVREESKLIGCELDFESVNMLCIAAADYLVREGHASNSFWREVRDYTPAAARDYEAIREGVAAMIERMNAPRGKPVPTCALLESVGV